jgi:NDP-sugar pyrophosphorylase family protein
MTCSIGHQVLLPLLNVPMLEYVMEFLVSSGVEEVRAVAAI